MLFDCARVQICAKSKNIYFVSTNLFNENFLYKTTKTPDKIGVFMGYNFLIVSNGGEIGIRTLETALTVYTISNRAPSAISDISP